MRLAAGLRPGSPGEPQRSPNPLAVIRGGKGGKEKGRVRNRKGEEGEGRT